ncbi:MAG: hypothetical protein ACTHOF_04120 [Flavisolibacter sp.]
MNKKRASIQFTSLTKLWEFRMVIKVNVFEINMKDITITCQCTQEDIDLALQQYKGKVVATIKEEV